MRSLFATCLTRWRGLLPFVSIAHLIAVYHQQIVERESNSHLTMAQSARSAIREFFVQCTGVAGLFLLTLPVLAQQTIPNPLPSELPIPANQLSADELDLRPFTGIWSDSTSNASFATIDQLAKLSPFPASTLKAHGKLSTIWLRFQLQNTHPTDTLRRLFFGGYHYSWGLSQSNSQNRRVLVQENGWLVRPIAPNSADAFTLLLTVPPGQRYTVWFQTTGYGLISAITPRLFTQTGYEHFRQARFLAQRNHFGYCCLIIGICLFLSLFAGVQSAYARDVTYLYWSLYLAATFLLFLLITDLGFNLQFVGPTLAALYEPSKYLIEIAYLLFLRSFLQTNQHLPRLNRVILVVVWCLLIAFGVSYWSTLTLTIPVIKFIAQVFLATQFLVLFIFVAVSRARVPNRQLFIVGSLGLNGMASVAAFLNKFGQTDFDQFWTDPTVWFSLGVVFELICFNLALSQRSRLAEREKQRLEHDKALEIQRVQLITDQFQQRIAETEMAGFVRK